MHSQIITRSSFFDVLTAYKLNNLIGFANIDRNENSFFLDFDEVETLIYAVPVLLDRIDKRIEKYSEDNNSFCEPKSNVSVNSVYRELDEGFAEHRVDELANIFSDISAGFAFFQKLSKYDQVFARKAVDLLKQRDSSFKKLCFPVFSDEHLVMRMSARLAMSGIDTTDTSEFYAYCFFDAIVQGFSVDAASEQVDKFFWESKFSRGNKYDLAAGVAYAKDLLDDEISSWEGFDSRVLIFEASYQEGFYHYQVEGFGLALPLNVLAIMPYVRHKNFVLVRSLAPAVPVALQRPTESWLSAVDGGTATDDLWNVLTDSSDSRSELFLELSLSHSTSFEISDFLNSF